MVSKEEYDYIVEHVSALRAKRDRKNNELGAEPEVHKPPPMPWGKVFTSPPVLAQITVKITITWVYSLVILKAPSYMEKVLQMPLEENGYFSSATFVSFALRYG